MRLGDLNEKHTKNYEESLKDRLQSVFQNIGARLNKSDSTGASTTNPNQASGQATNPLTSIGSALGKVAGAGQSIRQGIQGGIDAFKQGVDGGNTNTLTAREKSIYNEVDKHLKILGNIINRYQRYGVQLQLPKWNPASKKYVGKMVIDDSNFDKARMESILKNNVDPTPQGSRGPQDNQVAEAIKSLKQAMDIIVGAGGNDESKVVDDGVEIKFDMGNNQEALTNAVKKIQGIDINQEAGHDQIDQMNPAELTKAVREGSVELNQISEEQAKIVISNIDLIDQNAPFINQVAALIAVKAIDTNSDMRQMAQVLQTEDVIEGINLTTFGKALGLAKAKQLLQILGGNPPKSGMGTKQVMNLVKAALSSEEIEDISELDNMSDAAIALKLERGLLDPDDLADNQVNRMLTHYKFDNPSSKPDERINQLKIIIAMKGNPNGFDPKVGVEAIRRGLINTVDLVLLKPPNTLLQNMVKASGQRMQGSDRKTLITQLQKLENSREGSKPIDWRDEDSRQDADIKDLVKAIAGGQLPVAEITKEELKSLLEPNSPVAKEVDSLPLDILANMMPDAIDKEGIDINSASAKKLRAYLLGKGYKERLSGSLSGLRQQAKSLFTGEKISQMPKNIKSDAIEVLQSLLDDDGETYNNPSVKYAVNKAFKNIQSNDQSLERLLSMEEEDQSEELAKVARTIYYKRSGTTAPGDSQDSSPDPVSGGPVDPKVRRAVNDAVTVLERIKKLKKDGKQNLLTLADDLVKSGEKPGTDDFTSQLVAAYRKKFP